MDAATIEETNRIRVSLGMKPLPVPGADPSDSRQQDSESDTEAPSTVETRQAQAYDNYQKAQEAEETKKRRDERASAIRKAREKAQRFALLEGKGLGEGPEDGEQDAKAWLLGQRKRQKKIDKARKLEAELAAAEAEAAAAVQYTSKDLAGIKVAHDTSAFLEGNEQILTLKDTTIDENEEEGDELENLDMREHEKLTDRLDLKKRRPGYNPNDDEDEDRGILAQYDEEIDGKKRKKFTLDADGAIAELADILDQPAQRTTKIQNINLDDVVGKCICLQNVGVEELIDEIGDAPISNDYLDASEIKVKKPKKKKKTKQTRQKQFDEDDIFPLNTVPAEDDGMEVDSKEAFSTKRKAPDDAYGDDEDLQATLSTQRRNALKKRKKIRPEDIARQLREEQEDPEQANETRETEGLVIGEVSEFVAGLNKPDEEERRKPQRNTKTPARSPESDEDHPMDDDFREEEAVKRERSVLPDNTEEAGEDEEKAVGEGMGAALALLRERGLIEKSRADETYEDFRTREDFMTKKRMLEDELDDEAKRQRERDRGSGKLDRMSIQNREDYARQQNTWRDHQQSKRMAELFQAGYKPTVNLKYTDDHGRSLDQKEAFKHLSHQFHGKGSGKGKTEKRLKKIDDEKRREAQSMFDASQNGGMSVATAQQLKKRREAGVRLG